MSNIAKAWDKVKGPGDAAYDASHPVLKDELEGRAASIRKTGSTNKELMDGNDEWTVYDRFEAEFKNRFTAQDFDSPQFPEIDEPVPFDDEVKIKENGHADEKPLDKMSRAELDEIAKEEFGFNPSDFSNKDEIVVAIEKARSK